MSVFDQNFDYSEVFNLGSLKQSTKRHLSEVYQLLSALVAACAAGVFLNIKYDYGNQGAALLGFLCLIYVFSTSEKTTGRFAALIFFGLLEGMSIGKLVELSIMIDPAILLTALLSTLGIFVSFSLSALWSDRRHSLYLSGYLCSAIHVMVLLSILALFGFGSGIIFNINLYFGLLVMVGFVFVDTQLMINRCENEQHPDTYKDALNMFIDAVGIFVRILIILMKDSKKKEKD